MKPISRLTLLFLAFLLLPAGVGAQDVVHHPEPSAALGVPTDVVLVAQGESQSYEAYRLAYQRFLREAGRATSSESTR